MSSMLYGVFFIWYLLLHVQFIQLFFYFSVNRFMNLVHVLINPRSLWDLIYFWSQIECLNYCHPLIMVMLKSNFALTVCFLKLYILTYYMLLKNRYRISVFKEKYVMYAWLISIQCCSCRIIALKGGFCQRIRCCIII